MHGIKVFKVAMLSGPPSELSKYQDSDLRSAWSVPGQVHTSSRITAVTKGNWPPDRMADFFLAKLRRAVQGAKVENSVQVDSWDVGSYTNRGFSIYASLSTDRPPEKWPPENGRMPGQTFLTTDNRQPTTFADWGRRSSIGIFLMSFVHV